MQCYVHTGWENNEESCKYLQYLDIKNKYSNQHNSPFYNTLVNKEMD